MPSITCPYCQLVSVSKFLHKTHLRTIHPGLFNNNIKTSITGAKHELVPIPETVETTLPEQVSTEPASEPILVQDVTLLSESPEHIIVELTLPGQKLQLKFPISFLQLADGKS